MLSEGSEVFHQSAEHVPATQGQRPGISNIYEFCEMSEPTQFNSVGNGFVASYLQKNTD
jgi:hypothetical protein